MQEFKLIVAGGRDFTNKAQLEYELNFIADTHLREKKVSIVSGMARGADRMAWEYAKSKNIVCYEFPADWNKYGKAAGYRRNEEMGQFADGLLAFWDGKSRGTKHMIEYMRSLNKPVEIIHY